MAPVHPEAHGARSSLRITLTLADQEAAFSEFEVATLRFFLNGPLEQTLPLYELLGGHVLGVALADGPNDDRPTSLPSTSVRLRGFGAEEALYPWSARSFSGFRLLTEYFALPEKFLFVEISGLDARTLVQAGGRLEIFVYFDREAAALERRLRPDCMALGCTPVINLFPRRCEAVPLDQTRTEYPVVADYRRPGALEIWNIEKVSEIAPDGSSRAWRPFYGRVAAVSGHEEPAGFYNVVRRDNIGTVGGSDVLLAPFDPSQAADQPIDRVLSVEALCTNRDLPQRLPFGGGQPRLSAVDGLSSVTGITCLTAPTPTLRAPLRERRSLRLISHLSLGHLSVVGGPEAAAALREVLILHDLRDTPESRAAIAALVEVHAAEATARVPGARLGSFCRGLDVTLVFEQAAWASGGLFLLASVIERFLALHATVNSFVRTRVTLRGQVGEVARFPARAGAQVLL